MLHPKNSEAIDAIDAMLFSSDVLFDRDEFLSFKETMDRWNRKMTELDKESLEFSLVEYEYNGDEDDEAYLFSFSEEDEGEEDTLSFEEIMEKHSNNVKDLDEEFLRISKK